VGIALIIPKELVMNVRDTILYVDDSKSSIRTITANIVTRPKLRLTDGKRHPVTIIYPGSTKEIRLNTKVVKERG